MDEKITFWTHGTDKRGSSWGVNSRAFGLKYKKALKAIRDYVNTSMYSDGFAVVRDGTIIAWSKDAPLADLTPLIRKQ